MRSGLATDPAARASSPAPLRAPAAAQPAATSTTHSPTSALSATLPAAAGQAARGERHRARALAGADQSQIIDHEIMAFNRAHADQPLFFRPGQVVRFEHGLHHALQ